MLWPVSPSVVAERGSEPGSSLLVPTHQATPPAGARRRMPGLAPSLPLSSPLPTSLPPPQLCSEPQPLLTCPLPSVHPLHPFPATPANRSLMLRPTLSPPLVCTALTYTPLFTCTHIHHSPRQTAAESRSNISRLTSRQARGVMDRSPPFTALAPAMINVAPSALAFSTEKADGPMTCLCGRPMSSLEAAPTGEQEAFIKHLPCARCRARHVTNTLSCSLLTTRRQEDSSPPLNG